MLRTTVAVITAILLTTAAARADSGDAARLTGVWLFDAAEIRVVSDLGRVWTSTLTVAGDHFALSHFMDLSNDMTGTLAINPAVTPHQIDMKLDEFDLAEAELPMKIPAGTLPGIYKFDGDRLTVCFTIEIGGKRPTAFDAAGDNIAHVTLAKAPAGFAALPKTIRVVATGADGKPAAGAIVTGFMARQPDPKAEPVGSGWRYSPDLKTGADGTAVLPYEKLRYHPLLVRDPANKRMAVVPVTPFSLAKGEVAAVLQPECRVTGAVVSPELTAAGRPLGWTNVYVLKSGRRLAACASFGDGRFGIPLPPGSYTLNAYGEDAKTKNVPIIVPASRGEFGVEPITLAAQVLPLLEGRPAPDLTDIVGWKGRPVKLADLRGKYVLLEFWGYWCGPCVASMPVLIELHEKFADRGLVIVGIHADLDGEVDTAAKLDAKVAGFRKSIWKGKDLPFSVALTSGKHFGEGDAKHRLGPAGRYGILSWPTTVLIDPDGKIVGKFAARDAKDAAEQVEKLLNARK